MARKQWEDDAPRLQSRVVKEMAGCKATIFQYSDEISIFMGVQDLGCEWHNSQKLIAEPTWSIH